LVVADLVGERFNTGGGGNHFVEIYRRREFNKLTESRDMWTMRVERTVAIICTYPSPILSE
jgi:hypothetical protein